MSRLLKSQLTHLNCITVREEAVGTVGFSVISVPQGSGGCPEGFIPFGIWGLKQTLQEE